jgi:hypothetical protein
MDALVLWQATDLRVPGRGPVGVHHPRGPDDAESYFLGRGSAIALRPNNPPLQRTRHGSTVAVTSTGAVAATAANRPHLMQRETPTLVIEDPSHLREDSRDRWLMWFPIVGWMIAGCRYYARIQRAQEQVALQLKSRPLFPGQKWRDVGVPPELAERVAKSLADRMTWLPNHHFLPDDPLQYILLDEDGMGPFEATFAIGKDTGAKVKPGDFMRFVVFKDLVAEVLGQSATA